MPVFKSFDTKLVKYPNALFGVGLLNLFIFAFSIITKPRSKSDINVNWDEQFLDYATLDPLKRYQQLPNCVFDGWTALPEMLGLRMTPEV